MPILKIDSMGRIYQTSRDSEDGSGYGGHAVPVSQGDVTLGASYIKAAHAHQESILRDRRIRRLEDASLEKQKHEARLRAAKARSRAMNEQRLLENEAYQEMLKRKAVSMGCSCTVDHKISGHGLTSNGQRGFAGMSRDQQAIHRHLMGEKLDSSFMVDAKELIHKSQHNNNLRAAAHKLIAEQSKARIQSRRK